MIVERRCIIIIIEGERVQCARPPLSPQTRRRLTMGAKTNIDYKAAYEKNQAAHKKSAMRRQVKMALYERKAKAANITVSEEEITAELAKRAAKTK